MTPGPGDDGDLMQRYARGDAAAFDLLYARHRQALLRYLQRQLGNAAVAQDLFQDVWMRVIAHRGTYLPSAPFGTWLYRIAHNCCVDHWRGAARTRARFDGSGDDALEHVVDESQPTPEQQAISSDDGARLARALATLPDEQREAFLLYVEAGLDVPAIAEATDVGAETAKSRLRYAVAKLKRELSGVTGKEAP